MAAHNSAEMILSHVIKLENAKQNPLVPGAARSAGYFSMLKERRMLPMMQAESFNSFLKLYSTQQVVIVTAGTASGKSTQLTQRIMYLELDKGLQVVCTQPRRVAARRIAERVAAEMDVRLGDQVGVHHRDYNNTNETTRLKFVTEGILLRQYQEDPTLSHYSCVIIDECHERTADADILLALMKKTLVDRPGLKLIIMSATMNVQKFADYFGVSDTLHVKGNVFPLEIQYLGTTTPDYPNLALRVVKHIHEKKAPGNILVFLASAHQIEVAVSELRKGIQDLDVVPLYSSLPRDEQVKAFRSSSNRLCIVATNIAETSLTIEGVAYVVDGGVEIQEGYNPRVGMKSLLPAAISKASAEQRAGRANRTQSGVCFRLYTKEIFDNTFLNSSPPSILRTDIKKYILILKSAGFNAVGRFDFLEPPHPEVYLRGLQDLKAMNMIDSNGSITPAGNGSLQLSIEQGWYNALVEGLKLGCLDEMISIAALCSTRQSIFAKPHPQRYAAAIEHAEFANPISDHMTELDAFYKWQHQCKLGEKEAAIWCHEKFLDVEALKEALKLRKELLVKCFELFGVKTVPMLKFDDEEYDMKIRKAILRGFYHHTATVDDPVNDQYKTLDNYPVGINPDSSLVGMGWKFIVYNEIGFTSHAYMDRCTVVELDWLLDIDYFKNENLPQDYNGRVRNKKVREILANFDSHPEQPTAQHP
ncbi:pre-mrna splicing factor rna helicase [Fusarium napiforme]|uniref:Pre-mrna splicing factor rna helicase n=1 Tax=Fusarium napiforme TaxID=42672 RepID=A0A8H5K464_9HYPO|nr:pre-mrna splicing factor rna helicase [Fusarium napiforme]